jgi:hypothetical protein
MRQIQRYIHVKEAPNTKKETRLVGGLEVDDEMGY